MAGSDGRKSIFRKGKGRAMLRFIIYLLLLFILVSVGYIIIVSDPTQPMPIVNTAPTNTVIANTVPDSTVIANTVPESTVTENAVPDNTVTPSPTPAPTSLIPDPSPVFEMGFSDDVEYSNIEKLKPGNAITCGLISIDAFNDDNFVASLEVSAYAYIEGADASGSVVFLLTFNEQGVPYKMYTTQSEGSDGGNKERSSFNAKIDVSEYIEGRYSLGVAITNGNRTECALINGSAFLKNEMDEAVIIS